MHRLILRSFQSPGDILMLTAAVRDLHAAFPGRFEADVRTSADALFEHSPYRTRLNERDAGVRTIEMHYPLVHESNHRPYHFLHGYVHYLEQQLDLRIPVTKFHGDVHLAPEERAALPSVASGLPESFWIIVAGGKFDFTAKWWNPASYQAVVDHYRGKIHFVQCGEANHWHPRLQGVTDLIGKTTLRQFVQLMHFAAGVVCPVTFAMHLAAAVETRGGRPGRRPCVVIAGGREPPHWEAYPGHQFLSTIGMLPCCAEGGCWKSRCQLVGDGDAKDRDNVCEHPVSLTPELRIPKCMQMITPEDVIRRIAMYHEGGVMRYANGAAQRSHLAERDDYVAAKRAAPSRRVLLEFRHGLGDAVQFTSVLKHLRHEHPDWAIDVAALVGKHTAFEGLCRRTLAVDREPVPRGEYDETFVLDWHECRTAQAAWPSTKVARCLQEVFHLNPRPELCGYTIPRRPAAERVARRYLEQICPRGPDARGRFPAVLMHYEGNTSGDKKNLSHELLGVVCDDVLRLGYVPVILDWDRRSPLVDGVRIHNPGANHELWGGTGTGDAETLAALIAASRLMIGIDSGPLHVAGATTTPTVGVWTRHHPVHFFDLAANVRHLVPSDHAGLVAGPVALEYFTRNYQHVVYRQLAVHLPAVVESELTGEDVERLANRRFLQQLTSTAYNERYYQEHKMAGLDYLSFGDWQQQYGRWLVDSLGLKGKKLLDVGCACGSIVRGFGEAGAIVHGVDVNEHMIRLGREKWPDMAPLLGTCDAVNLHLYTDGSWDAIHTAQVAEHWKPQLVPHILQEFARVVRPGGLLFCALDTEELFTRQGRTAEREDPTHICVRPMRWWQKQLVANGWQVCTAEFESRLRNHPQSYLKRYDWDWFVAQRAPVREEINSNSPQPVETTTSVLAPPPPTPQPSRPFQPQRPSTKVGSSPPASRPVSSQSTGSTLPPNNSPPSVPAASDQMPPLSTQIWNVMGSLAAFVADGAKTVSAEEYQRRLEICETCPRRRRNRCLECGCRLSIKAQARAMRCPLGKWA